MLKMTNFDRWSHEKTSVSKDGRIKSTLFTQLSVR